MGNWLVPRTDETSRTVKDALANAYSARGMGAVRHQEPDQQECHAER
jgi:hypothetical protein